MFMPDDERRSENMQTLVTPSDRQRIEWLAEQEDRTVSDMMRVLLLDSLKVWESSHAGRSPEEEMISQREAQRMRKQ